MPEIDQELKGTTYHRFIDYAIEKSDAFMLVVRRHRTHTLTLDEYINKLRLNGKLAYLTDFAINRINENDLFKKEFYRTELFCQEIEPFRIKIRHNPVWPSTKVGGTRRKSLVPDFDICVYRSCQEIKPFLLRVSRLYEWMYPYFPEDLCFFKEHKCWFYTCSHEERSYILADSVFEVKTLADMGIEFFDEYDQEYETNGRYFEEY